MRLNGRVINPGELTVKVSLQTKTMVKDAGGAQKPTYSTFATVWAKWVNAHGIETEASGGIVAERPATVLIRYHASLNETCVVLKGTERFEISSIDDIYDRHEWIEFKATRAKAG